MMKIFTNQLCIYRKLNDNDDTIDNKIISFTTTAARMKLSTTSSSLSSLTSSSTRVSSSLSSSLIQKDRNPVSILVPISKQTLVLELFDTFNSTLNNRTCEFQIAQQQQHQQYRKKRNIKHQIGIQQNLLHCLEIKIITENESIECYLAKEPWKGT